MPESGWGGDWVDSVNHVTSTQGNVECRLSQRSKLAFCCSVYVCACHTLVCICVCHALVLCVCAHAAVPGFYVGSEHSVSSLQAYKECFLSPALI